MARYKPQVRESMLLLPVVLSAFGVGAMELGRHKLDPAMANVIKLIELFGEENVQQFQRLAQHGFEFFYLPNA